jgi:alpha-L-fucosidase
MTVPKPGEQLVIKSLGKDAKLLEKTVGNVTLLGSAAKIVWTQEADGLHLKCPEEMPFSYSVVFKIATH